MLKRTKQRRSNNNNATKMTATAATIPSTLTTTTRRTPTQPRRQQQQKQKSNKNGNRNDSDENGNNNNNQYQNCFHESSPYYNPYKSSGKNKAKRYFRHSLQRSVPMAPLSSEYFSNSSLYVKGLMGQFCQSM